MINILVKESKSVISINEVPQDELSKRAIVRLEKFKNYEKLLE